jgi:hypothetical protein
MKKMRGIGSMTKDWSKMHNTLFSIPKPKRPKGFKIQKPKIGMRLKKF